MPPSRNKSQKEILVLEELVRQNNKLIEELRQISNQSAIVNVMLYCSQRYTQLIGPAKEELYKHLRSGEESESIIIRHKIEYFDSYWQLQLEQYKYYQLDLVMPSIYEYWLLCRRKDWRISEIVKEVLDEQQISVRHNPIALAEIENEQKSADFEQRIFRSGWERAKKYLTDQEFVRKMDDVMQESGNRAITAMLQKNKT